MNTKRFNEVVAAQIKLSTDILCVKAGEYATDDRLHNFKVAAELQGCSPKEALAGMMAKHTVSVYDLCCLSRAASIEMWSEKITDSINYLLLLRAVIQEEMDERENNACVSDASQEKIVIKANPKLLEKYSPDLIRDPFGGGRTL